MSSKVKSVVMALAIASGIIVLDQSTKWSVLYFFNEGTIPTIVNDFFNIVCVFNRGISFGLFNKSNPYLPLVFSSIAFGVSFFLTRWLYNAPSLLRIISCGLLIGGALGNVADRVFYKAVVDFLDFHWNSLHFPAFNVADSAITIGAGILILISIIEEYKNK